MLSDLVKGNAVIGQSGGPTAVINQSLVGVVEGLRAGLASSGVVGRVLGMRHGVRGLTRGDFIDLTDMHQDRLDRLAVTPSAGLGSTRDKPDDAYCDRVLEACRKNDIRYFFYIGGNDSSDTCRIVREKAKHRLRPPLLPRPQDRRQRPARERPHPRLPQRRPLRRHGLHGRLHGQHQPPGHQDQRGDGPARGIPDRRQRPGPPPRPRPLRRRPLQHRRPPAHLPARGALRPRPLRGRRRSRLREEGPLPHRGFRGHPRQERQGDRRHPHQERTGRRPRQRPALRQRRTRRSARRPAQGETHAQGRQAPARPRRHLRLRPALLPDQSPIDAAEARRTGQFAARLAMQGEHDGSVAIIRQSSGSEVWLGREGLPYVSTFRRVELSAIAAKTRHMPAEFIQGHNNVSRASSSTPCRWWARCRALNGCNKPFAIRCESGCNSPMRAIAFAHACCHDARILTYSMSNTRTPPP